MRWSMISRITFISFFSFVALLSLNPAMAAGRSDVADAVMNGNAERLRLLLQQKADVNVPQTDGATALHWAVYRDDLETVNLLIRAGAKIDVKNREGISPLAMASLSGNLAVVDKLLEAGSDARQRGPSDETMLMLAARNGRPDVIRRLVAAGADVNAVEDLRKTTALMWAAEQKHPEAVKALLDVGADFKIRSGPAGLPRNYMAAPVNLRNMEAARKRYAEAAGAGRTYFEQLDYEEAHGIQHEGRRDAAARVATQGTPPPEEDTDTIVAGLVGTGGGGLTALVFASREGDIESAKSLLDS